MGATVDSLPWYGFFRGRVEWMSGGRSWTAEAVRMVLPLLIVAGGIVGFWVLKQRRPGFQQEPEAPVAPVVDTASVARHQGPLTIKVDGHVVPFRQLVLSAEVAGRVVRKAEACRAGRFVRRGELLLEIDRRDYELAKRQAVEQLEQAAVMLEELEVEVANTDALIRLAEDELELAQSELDRQLELRRQKATSQAAVDLSRSNLLKARNALLGLQSQRQLLNTRRVRLESAKQLAQVSLEKAELDLQRTRVVAPIDGMVVLESVEEDSFVAKGTPLVTLEDTSAVEVSCHLRMDQLYWVLNQRTLGSAGDQASRTQEDYQLPETPATVVYRLGDRQYVWQGTLWRYEGIGLDERTRTVPCRVRVDQPRQVRLRSDSGLRAPEAGPRALVRGMFVTVEIHAEPREELWRVPEAAVRPSQRLWCVRQGRLQSVPVRVVMMQRKMAVIQAEGRLRAGDQVVVSPVGAVMEGARVRVRETTAGGELPVGQVAVAEEGDDT